MKKLVIIGAGGHGKVVADAAEKMGCWCQVVFIDAKYPNIQSCGHWPVVATDSDYANFNNVEFVVAIGSNKVRQDIQRKLSEQGRRIATIVHPSASVSEYCSIGSGSVVFAGAVVNVDCQIGEGSIINTLASIDHDCLLGDFVHVSPGANLAGEVSMGDRTWVGIGAAVRQQCQVGFDAIIGAGAVVIKDVPANATVVGNPARPLSKI